jgi:hypothetical protein
MPAAKHIEKDEEEVDLSDESDEYEIEVMVLDS